MLGILRDRHMEITEDLPQADIIIVNTCTFIEKAKQESIDTILQAARYKTEEMQDTHRHGLPEPAV